MRRIVHVRRRSLCARKDASAAQLSILQEAAMSAPRPTTAAELRRLVAEENWREVSDRYIEHHQACGHSLPEVLSELTVAEREQLVEVLFRIVETGDVVH